MYTRPSSLTVLDDGGCARGTVSNIPLQTCPRCLGPLSAIKGSRLAVCRRCGYKDDCC